MKPLKFVKLELTDFGKSKNKIFLDNCDGVKGYFAGSMQLSGISFHVEAIEVKDKVTKYLYLTATNQDYQSRVDDWLIRNEQCIPALLEHDGKKYFINIEPYAV